MSNTAVTFRSLAAAPSNTLKTVPLTASAPNPMTDPEIVEVTAPSAVTNPFSDQAKVLAPAEVRVAPFSTTSPKEFIQPPLLLIVAPCSAVIVFRTVAV